MTELKKRSDKKLFYGVLDEAEEVFTRLRYFTELQPVKILRNTAVSMWTRAWREATL